MKCDRCRLDKCYLKDCFGIFLCNDCITKQLISKHFIYMGKGKFKLGKAQAIAPNAQDNKGCSDKTAERQSTLFNLILNVKGDDNNGR